MSQHLTQRDGRVHDVEAVKFLPIGNEGVQVAATTKKTSTVQGFVFPSFGAAHILDARIPIIIAASRTHLVLGQLHEVRIAHVCITELLLRGADFGQIALAVFVSDERHDEFFEKILSTGLRNFFITNPRAIAGDGHMVEVVRPRMHELLGIVLH